MQTLYNKRTWLNSEDSPSTGNVVCYDGWNTDRSGKEFHNVFVSVSDCNVSARIHKTSDDSFQDYINKVEKLRDALTDYLNHLQNVPIYLR